MIKIQSVTKSYKEKEVLKDICLEVKTNEILTLLGPNGCGKTTLLNMVSGLTRPDHGNIYINDELVYGGDGSRKVNLPPSERKVGYVFQTISLFPHMSVQDNVAYGLKALHLPKKEIQSRTKALLDFVDLGDYARFYPDQLSGGQKQRTALARSLATEPQVLLLDEPVSSVDPQLRESFRLELKNYLRKLNITVVYVTHNLSEAFVMSDRIAVIGNGRVEQIGSGQELFDRPSSSYVAKFLGINAFNAQAHGTLDGYLEVEANSVKLLATSADYLKGKAVVATLKPENIKLSTTPDPAAQNCLPGVLTEMAQMRSTAQVTIDVGFSLKARLPLTTVKALGVGIGDKVYVCFDADALNVFADNPGQSCG